jgi:RNA polymerase sigma-70 factor (ECF subfamily)
MNEEEELDRTAVERCRKGDLEAFGTLIDRYERPVFNAILHMVGNAEDAREICQQVFMKAFEHLDSYDANRRFFSWIYRVAMNESINHLKARRTHEPLSETLRYPLPDPAQRYEATEQRHHLQKAIMSLDENYRAVLILRHFVHLSYHEVAEVLGVSDSIVKSRLFTARELLRQALEAQGHVT